MDKVLTIVVPTYNMERFLDKCLSSLVLDEAEQRMLYEVLVVIDGATDSSEAIARGYEERFPDTFRVIAKENGGHGSCCNRGLREAKGKYIHFLDSDDWFDAEFADYLRQLASLDVDVVQTRRVDEFSDRGVTKVHRYDIAYGQCCQLADFDFNRVDKSFFSIHESTFRTALLRDNHIVFLEGCSYDDTIFRVAPFPGAKTLCVMDVCLYHYLQGRPGQSVARDVKRRKLGQLERNIFQLLDYVAAMDAAALPENVAGFLHRVFTDHANRILRNYIKVKTLTRRQDVMRCYQALCQSGYRPWIAGSHYFESFDRNHSSWKLSCRFAYYDGLEVLYRLFHPFH